MTEDQEYNEYEAFAKRMEERFPLMFAERYGGFAVGKGWWPILENLCANIQGRIDWAKKQHDWDVENKKEPARELIPQVVVEQIKEKFGGLRFYYQGGDEYIHGMVTMAESWADSCCEECCAPGRRRSGGWIRTLCDYHEAEHQKRLSDREAEYAKQNGLEM